MSKRPTLTLPKKDAPALVVPTDDQIREYLQKQETAAKAATTHDWKYDAPVESKPFDLSTLTPQNSRAIPVQAPQKVWGDPKWLKSK